MTPSSLDLIIFDCDGVIVDSELLSTRASAAALAEFGLDLTEQQVASLFLGLTLEDGLQRIRQQYQRELPPAFAARKMQLTEQLFRQELTPVQGLVALLQQLTTPYCVASNSAHQRLRFSFEATGLSRYFAGRIYSAEDVAQGKPAPDLFLHAARQQHAEPQRCLVIDDSTSGVRAAVAAGIPVIGFVGASHAYPALADQLREAGATWVMPDYAAVRKHIEQYNVKEFS
ncbi:HAD family hydrolase [Advenella mimigardefordensis]|uniref:Putative hydrolase, haloacid dehalogenase (HAD) superfamily n=1 Tax=Advenella mimigardefordensis (strain DSM 17166 / LMG 22922 / DPN7) TaxID=1247726 RepID=W0PIN2_ADVMD|nr:HAD family hydrolase [Advenella mimigardefordensis]AHG65350.1 putative hydrolase, haloacid dehalogenase (HAD) superfamily [Advenella mimigardefordensis DPN7]